MINPKEINVENPKDIFINFFDSNHELIAKALVFRVDIKKIGFISKYKFYHPNAEGGFERFEYQLKQEFAKLGSRVGIVDQHQFEDIPIIKIDYEVIRDSPQ